MPNINRYLILLLLTLASAGFMYFLHKTNKQQVNITKNGFNRKFNDNLLSLVAKHDNPAHANTLLYADGNYFYLLNDAKQEITVADKNFSIVQQANIPEKCNIKQHETSIIHYFNNKLYMLLPNRRKVFSFSLPGLDTASFVYGPQIIKGFCLGNGKTISRVPAGTTAHFAIVENSVIKKDTNLSPPGIRDGGLATDGNFVADGQTRILYQQYFTNQLLVMDTALGSIKRITTIDTNTVCKNYIGILKEKTYSFLGPLSIVNKNVIPGPVHYYVLSGLRADNEPAKSFYNNTTIDAYDKETGQYVYSFKVPNDNGAPLTCVYIQDGKFFCVYPKRVYEFNLNP